MKKISKFHQSRLFITGLLMLLQVITLAVILFFAASRFSLYYILTMILAFLVILDLANQNMNPSFKLPWVILVMAVPIIGRLFIYSLQNQSRTDELQSASEITAP